MKDLGNAYKKAAAEFCNTIMAFLPMLIGAIMIYVVGIYKLHN